MILFVSRSRSVARCVVWCVVCGVWCGWCVVLVLVSGGGGGGVVWVLCGGVVWCGLVWSVFLCLFMFFLFFSQFSSFSFLLSLFLSSLSFPSSLLSPLLSSLPLFLLSSLLATKHCGKNRSTNTAANFEAFECDLAHGRCTAVGSLPPPLPSLLPSLPPLVKKKEGTFYYRNISGEGIIFITFFN